MRVEQDGQGEAGIGKGAEQDGHGRVGDEAVVYARCAVRAEETRSGWRLGPGTGNLTSPVRLKLGSSRPSAAIIVIVICDMYR